MRLFLRFPLAPLLPALLFASVIIGCRQAPDEEAAPASPAGPVTLEIDAGDGEPARYEVPDVAPGTTVEAVLEKADAMEDGPEVEITGSGTTAFVRAIGGRASEGERAWMFFVNDQWAERGVGQMPVEPGDVLRFEYGTWDD